MKNFITILQLFYIDIQSICSKIKGLFWYFRDYLKFKNQNKRLFNLFINPKLFDKCENHPNKAGHYLLQDVYVARKILKNNPSKHVDVGSRIDGFIIQLSLFREVEVIDIRGFPINIENVIFRKIDFTDIPKEYFEYTDSISSLHAIEHFGLGRYGDKIDSDGHLKGIQMIHKVLKRDGHFYLSVPIGPQRVEFNAHRVFNLEYLVNIITPLFKIIDFAYIDDNGQMNENVPLEGNEFLNNFFCNYGCGIFELRKIS